MARISWGTVVAALAWSVLPAAAAEPVQQTAETFLTDIGGASLYRTYCASCHGTSAKGDGPLADHLRFRPPDLTLFAKRDGGKFEADKVYRIIDGRDPVKGHGGPDMPVWGDAFKHSSEGYSEKAVKARINALVDHVESIQAK